MFYYCQTSVLFLISGGILSGYLSLPALHLSGTSSQRTGTRPPSCLYLDNRLFMNSSLLLELFSVCLFCRSPLFHDPLLPRPLPLLPMAVRQLPKAEVRKPNRKLLHPENRTKISVTCCSEKSELNDATNLQK